MSDAPEILWLWPAEPEDGVDKFVSFPGQRYPSGSTTYIRADVVRADLSDALLREAMEALQWLREVTEPPDRNCSCHRSAPCGWCEQHAAVAEAHEETRATLAKLWAFLEDR